MGVPRLCEGSSPIWFYKLGGGVYVENIDNTSRITVDCVDATKQFKPGERERLDREREVATGSETSFRVSTESVANDDRPAATSIKTVSTAGDSELLMSAVVTLNCDAFAEERSRHKALLYGQRILNVVQVHSVDTPQYNEVVEQLEQRLKQIQTLDATEVGHERR